MIRALVHAVAVGGLWLMTVAALTVLGVIARAFVLAPPMRLNDNRSLAAKLQDSKIQQQAMDAANARGRAK